MKNLITEKDYKAALAKGRAEMEMPHATDARLMPGTSYLVVLYSNGLVFGVDASVEPHLRDYDLALLRDPQLTTGGDGILFEAADLALNLPNLLAPYMPLDLARSRVAAELGSKKSEKKAEAARANGARGGRPKKVEEHAVARGETTTAVGRAGKHKA